MAAFTRARRARAKKSVYKTAGKVHKLKCTFHKPGSIKSTQGYSFTV
jgi:hypothetical protein